MLNVNATCNLACADCSISALRPDFYHLVLRKIAVDPRNTRVVNSGWTLRLVIGQLYDSAGQVVGSSQKVAVHYLGLPMICKVILRPTTRGLCTMIMNVQVTLGALLGVVIVT